VEHKKAQSDDTKKISIDNSHAAAVDTSELVAEMMVCFNCLASISLKPGVTPYYA
jgi:hypothetical protein